MATITVEFRGNTTSENVPDEVVDRLLPFINRQISPAQNILRIIKLFILSSEKRQFQEEESERARKAIVQRERDIQQELGL